VESREWRVESRGRHRRDEHRREAIITYLAWLVTMGSPEQNDTPQDASNISEGEEEENPQEEIHEWSAFHDDEGRMYFYNSTSGESAWDAPAKFNPPPPPEEGELPAGVEATEEGQEDAAMEDAPAENADSEDRPELEPSQESAGGAWVAYQDDEGREYFFNTVTEATTWERPPDFKPEPDAAQAEAEPSSPSRLASPVLMDDQPPTPEPHQETEAEEIPEEEPEETIDPVIKRVQAAKDALNQPDAIMEPGECYISTGFLFAVPSVMLTSSFHMHRCNGSRHRGCHERRRNSTIGDSSVE
jgi:hypothetical protein